MESKRKTLLKRPHHDYYYPYVTSHDELLHLEKSIPEYCANCDNNIWVDNLNPLGGESLVLKRPEPCFEGITPQQVHEMCIELDISHYAFDITGKCVLKHVCTNQKNHHGPTLVYFAIDNHMYHVDRDAKNEDGISVVNSLIRKATAIEHKFDSNIFKTNEKEINIYNEADIYENIQVQDFKNYHNCIIIYDKLNLEKVIEEIVLTYGYIPTKYKYDKFNCVQVKFNHKKHSIICVVDPNRKHDKHGLTWQDIKQLCEQFNIDFQNQTFNAFIKELRQIHFNNNHSRVKFSKKTKTGVSRK